MASLARCLAGQQRRLDSNLGALRRQVTPERVHAARTAARRLRALLQVFRRQLPSRTNSYRLALKRVSRELGRVRDGDVARRSVDNLAPARSGRCRDELESLSTALEHRRRGLASALQTRMAKKSWSQWVSTLRSGAAAQDIMLSNEQPIGTVAWSLLRRRRRRLRARLLESKRTPRALHRLRLKVKTLRYFAEEIGTLTAARVDEEEVAALVGLQDTLGKLHDLEALRQSLRPYARYRHAARELRAKAATRRRHLLRDYDVRRAALLRIWEDGGGGE